MLLQLWLIIYLHDPLKRDTWILFPDNSYSGSKQLLQCKIIQISANAVFVSVRSEGGSETKRGKSDRAHLNKNSKQRKKDHPLVLSKYVFSTIFVVKIQNLNEFK